MRRTLHRILAETAGWLGGAALAWAVALTAPATAQTAVLYELYGNGVHAYNSGYYREAYNDLTMAIRSGSRDPRAYYFRGLAYLQLGRPQEAQADFKTAAALEMADTDRFYPVSKSLERVQGSARQQIERYRARARLVAFQTRERRRFERYERIRKNEPNVLAAPDEAAEMPGVRGEPTPAPPRAAADEPVPDEPAADEPEAEMPADDMPADDMPAEKPEADADDPFAEASDDKEPAEEMPADDIPADDIPADDIPADDMPADDMPADGKPEPGDDDPFAEDGDSKEPAEAMPADEGDEKPADEGGKKPADDDPFSN